MPWIIRTFHFAILSFSPIMDYLRSIYKQPLSIGLKSGEYGCIT